MRPVCSNSFSTALEFRLAGGEFVALLADLGAATAAKFGARLHAPVGLELGGRDSASIALAITAGGFAAASLPRRDPPGWTARCALEAR